MGAVKVQTQGLLVLGLLQACRAASGALYSGQDLALGRSSGPELTAGASPGTPREGREWLDNVVVGGGLGSANAREFDQLPSYKSLGGARGEGAGGLRRSRRTDAADDADGDPNVNDDAAEKEVPYLFFIYVTLACGAISLLFLCLVRRLAELCQWRNEMIMRRAARLAEREGLPMSSIDNLPQMKYRAAGGGKRRACAPCPDSDSESAENTPPAGKMGGGLPGGGGGGGGGSTATATAGGVEDGNSTTNMCAICLMDYEIGDVLRVIPGCKHRFHKDCIDPWLATKGNCAMCKSNVPHKRTASERLRQTLAVNLGVGIAASPPGEAAVGGGAAPAAEVHFSSSRRTYTSAQVHQAFRLAPPPNVPDDAYVGSMLTTEPANPVTPAMSRANSGGGGGGGGPGGGDEPVVGTVVAQPESAPAYVVIPLSARQAGVR